MHSISQDCNNFGPTDITDERPMVLFDLYNGTVLLLG